MNETAERGEVPISENAAASSSSGTPLLDMLTTGNPYVPHYSAVSGAADGPAAPTVSSRLPPMATLPAARVKAAAPYPEPPVHSVLAHIFFLGGSTHFQKKMYSGMMRFIRQRPWHWLV